MDKWQMMLLVEFVLAGWAAAVTVKYRKLRKDHRRLLNGLAMRAEQEMRMLQAFFPQHGSPSTPPDRPMTARDIVADNVVPFGLPPSKRPTL